MGIWKQLCLCGIDGEERDAPLSAFPGIPSQLSGASGSWECFCHADARAWLLLSRVGLCQDGKPQMGFAKLIHAGAGLETGKQEFPLCSSFGSWLNLSWIGEIPKIQCREAFGVWAFV